MVVFLLAKLHYGLCGLKRFIIILAEAIRVEDLRDKSLASSY